MRIYLVIAGLVLISAISVYSAIHNFKSASTIEFIYSSFNSKDEAEASLQAEYEKLLPERADLVDLMVRYHLGTVESEEEQYKASMIDTYPHLPAVAELLTEQLFHSCLSEAEMIWLHWAIRFPYQPLIADLMVDNNEGKLTEDEKVGLYWLMRFPNEPMISILKAKEFLGLITFEEQRLLSQLLIKNDYQPPQYNFQPRVAPAEKTCLENDCIQA